MCTACTMLSEKRHLSPVEPQEAYFSSSPETQGKTDVRRAQDAGGSSKD